MNSLRYLDRKNGGHLPKIIGPKLQLNSTKFPLGEVEQHPFEPQNFNTFLQLNTAWLQKKK